MNDFIFQIFEVGIIEVIATFDRAIGYPPLALEYVDNLGEDVVKRHDRHSAG